MAEATVTGTCQACVDEVVQIEPGLVEIRYRFRNGDRGMSRRLRERPDWIRVETPGHGGPDRGTVSP